MRIASTKPGLAAVALALMVGAGTFFYERSDSRPTAQAPAPEPIPVIATTVRQHDVPIVLTGLGTVVALNTATVRSQVTGLLTSVNFQEGQAVKKGDLLGQVDPRTYQAQLDQSEATLSHDQSHLANAELNLRRYSDLVKQDSIAVQQVDNQKAAVDELNAQIKSDRAAIENARTELSYTSLVAPFDGMTGFRLLDVGNIIHPPTSSTAVGSAANEANALVVVTQLQPISVIFSLATTSIPAVQRAMANGPLRALAFSQNDKAQLDAGELMALNNRADTATGTVQLKAVFPNEQRQLWPGAFVNVRLVVSTDTGGLTIPLDAITQGPKGPFVYVVGADHRVAIRAVSVRQSFNGEALIVHGLSVGETIVVRGQYRLSPDALVALADPNNPAAVPNPTTESAGMLP